MDTGLFIALRYLFAKKSHNVINVISAISAAGMAIGTAALILILSIYNGFDRVIEANMSDLDPDILISSAVGKRFVPEGEAFDAIFENPAFSSVSEVIEEQVFIMYGSSQGLAVAKGVDSRFAEASPLAAHVVSGEFSLYKGDRPQACVGASLAREMGINPRFLERLDIYCPRTNSGSPLMGLYGSFGSVGAGVSSLFSINTEVDSRYIIVPIGLMRELLGDETGVTGIEIRTDSPVDKKTLRSLQESLGPDFVVADRYAQRPAIYKMMRYEKLAIYLILLFVVIIVAFNIFGSLSMLRIEKTEDVATLHAMGATESFTQRIFVLEGWLVSLLGLVCGLVAGVVAALLQQHFGLVKMPGNFLIQSYPCVLEWGDVLLTVAGVALTGFLISLLASRAKD